MTVDELMHMVRNAAAAWHRDESLENPRVFKFPAAEAKLRDAIEQALSVEWENGRCAGVVLTKQALEYDPAQERERAEKDAQRYRWLRSTTNWATSKGERIDVRNKPDLWDAAIDEGIRKGTP